MKKYFIAAALLLLLTALYLFHHYAARQAEEELDRTLRGMVSDTYPSSGIQFSEVEIAPFSGTLTIYDLNVFTDRHLQRGSLMRFDLGYPMFLRIYFGDAAAALDRELSLRAHMENVTWLDRYRLREVSLDTLELEYRGNPTGLLSNLLRSTPLETRQELDARGRGFAWSEPYLDWGTVRADSLQLRRTVPAGSAAFWPDGSLEADLQRLSWDAPNWFTETYGFFIRGFQYSGNAIPIRSFSARAGYREASNSLEIARMELRSEHVKMGITGTLPLRDPAGSAPLEGITLKLSDYSSRFRGVLQGLNRLFQLNLPADADSLSQPLGGTLADPALQGN